MKTLVLNILFVLCSFNYETIEYSWNIVVCYCLKLKFGMICTIVLCSDACIFIEIQRSCSILGFFTSSPNLFVALNNFRFLSVISGYSRNPFFILELTGVFVGGFQFKLATYDPTLSTILKTITILTPFCKLKRIIAYLFIMFFSLVAYWTSKE